jgi:hypothetical protein
MDACDGADQLLSNNKWRTLGERLATTTQYDAI